MLRHLMTATPWASYWATWGWEQHWPPAAGQSRFFFKKKFLKFIADKLSVLLLLKLGDPTRVRPPPAGPSGLHPVLLRRGHGHRQVIQLQRGERPPSRQPGPEDLRQVHHFIHFNYPRDIFSYASKTFLPLAGESVDSVGNAHANLS